MKSNLLRSFQQGFQVCGASVSLAICCCTSVFSQTPACVSPPAGAVAWWPLDGDATDALGTNAGTIVGNAPFAVGEVGQALSFDGVNDEIDIAPSPGLNIGAGGGFTVELWISPNSTASPQPVLEWNNRHDYVGLLIWFSLTGQGSLYADLIDTNNVGHHFASAPGVLLPNVWQHVALTYDKSSGIATFYRDGTNVAQQTLGAITVETRLELFLGRRVSVSGSQYRFAGLMDEVTLYNRTLSDAEIGSIYDAGAYGKCRTPQAPTIVSQPQNLAVRIGDTASFTVLASGTPPLTYRWQVNSNDVVGATNASLTLTNVQLAQAGDYSVVVTNALGSVTSSNATLAVNPQPPCVTPPAGAVAWWALEGNAFDVVGANAGSILGNPSFVAGEVGQALVFDGVTVEVDIPASPALNIGAGNGFTIELWLNPDSTASPQPVLEWNNRHDFVGLLLWFSLIGQGSLYADLIDTNNVGHHFSSPPGVLLPHVWQHIALTYDRSSGLATVYRNGTSVAQQTVIGLNVETSFELFLGRRVSVSGSQYRYKGLMDEVSLYNRALSIAEIQSIFGAGASGKCVSPRPPAIVSQPQDRTVTAGSQVTFSVAASGTLPFNYQWHLNGVDLGGATNQTLVLSNVQVADGGSYSVDVANDLGLVTSSNAVLTVNPPPVPATYDLSRDVSITTNPSGVWSYGAQGSIGGPFSLLPFPFAQPADNGAVFQSWSWSRYEQPVVGWNASSFTATNSGGQGIFPPGTVYFAAGSDGSPQNFASIRLTLPPGAAGSYEVQTAVHSMYDGSISGDSDFHVVHNGIEVFGYFLAPSSSAGYTNTLVLGDGDTLDFMVGRGADGMEYGSGLKVQATLNLVSTNPVAPTIVAQPQSQAVLAGANVTFTVVASGTAPLTYQWQLDGGAIAGETNASLILNNVQTNQSGNYSVVITNATDSVTSSNAVLTVSPLPPCVAPPEGLVSWWTGDGDATDRVGGNNGTLQNGASCVAGEVGLGFHLDGVNDYINIPDSPSLSFTNEFTLETWFKKEQPWVPDTQVFLFDKRDLVSGNYAVSFSINNGLLLQFKEVQSGSYQFASAPLPTAGVFHHFAGTYRQADATHVELKIYVDGQLAQSGLFPGNLANTVNKGALTIGGPRGLSNFFPGIIDEPAIYNRALTADEIQSIFNAGAGGKCKAPVAPYILSQPQSLAVTDGANATFTVGASGTAPLSYQWLLDGVNLAGATNPTLTLFNVQPGQAGGYSVVVANDVGSVTSDTATLTVNPLPPGPPVILSITASQSVDAGATASFTVAANGTGPLFYQWRLNSVNLTGATNETISFNPAQVSDSGNYDVVVRNSGGSVTSPVVTLTVISITIPPAITAQPGSRYVPLGSSTTFNVGVSGTGPFDYQWYFNGAAFADATNSSLMLSNVQPAQAGTYWVVVSNPFGSASSKGSVLQVTGQAGGQVLFYFNGSNYVYDVDGTTLVPAGTAFLAQLYAGPSADSLQPVGAASFFSAPGHVTFGQPSIPTVEPGQVAWVQMRVWESAYGTTYEQALAAGGKTGVSLIAHVTTGGGTGSDGNPPMPPPPINGWRSFSLVPGQVASPPTITVQPVGQSVLLGAAANLSVTASGPGLLQYQWYLNGSGVGGATAPTLALASAGISDGGDYTVVVRNSGGAVTSQVATVTVLIERVLSVISPPDQPEGALVSVPVQLSSLGDVGAMTFVLQYNPDYLSMPTVSWDSSLDGALKEANVPTLGQVRAVFALTGSSLPAGTQTLATVNFRARTVLTDTTTPLSPSVVDVATAAGDPILYGTEADGGSARLLAGSGLPGDNNGNGRLDVGDATLLLRLLAQMDAVRSWDITGNDFNQNGMLDSGDVIKILRVVAGIDPSPGGPKSAQLSPLAASFSPKEEKAGPSPVQPQAVLAPLTLKATSGQLVTVQVRLENLQTSIAGASFTLNYPVAALRLLGASALRIGTMVPPDAVAIWNVAPGQNNFAAQNGHVTLVVTSPSAWQNNTGVLAELTFQVQPGATNQYAWPMTLSSVETTADGYDTSALVSEGMLFIGRDPLPGMLGAAGRNASGQFQFTLNGDAGAGYVVEVSTNLVNWTPMVSTTNSVGSLQVMDPDSTNFMHRFYRSRPAP